MLRQIGSKLSSIALISSPFIARRDRFAISAVPMRSAAMTPWGFPPDGDRFLSTTQITTGSLDPDQAQLARAASTSAIASPMPWPSGGMNPWSSKGMISATPISGQPAHCAESVLDILQGPTAGPERLPQYAASYDDERLIGAGP